MQSTANTISVASTKPVVALLLPSAIRAKILTEETEERLASIATVTAPADDQLTAQNLPALLEHATAALSGWGTPPFSAAALAQAPKLAFVAHAAGSIRRLKLSDAIESSRIRGN